MIPGSRKLRYLLATRPDLLARVCVAVALLGLLGAGFTFVDPPTAEVTATADRRPVATTLTSQATVEGESVLYARGETLSNMPVYSRSVTPNVTVSAATTVPSGEEVRVDQRIALVYEARTAEDELFWRQTRILRRTNATADGGAVVSNATLTVPSIDRRIGRIESEIGDAGRAAVYLEVESEYRADSYDGVLTDRGAITVRADSYEIERFSMEDEHRTTASRTRPIPSKVVRVPLPLLGALVVPHTTLAFSLLGLLGTVGVGASVAFAGRFDPAAERTALQRARYAEWISTGTLPTDVGDRTVRMETLVDLVDVAIDAEKRIVRDPSSGRCAVIDGNTVYVYREGPP